MKTFTNRFRFFPKVLSTSACAAAVAFSAGQALAQSNQTYPTSSYTTNFDGDQGGSTLSGQDGWDTTDANQSDYVGVVTGYSTTPDNGTTGMGGDHLAELGGQSLPGTVPSQTTNYLFHATPLGGSTVFAFNVDFAVSSSQTPYSSQDAFGFTLQSTTGNNILAINFRQTATAGTDAARYQVGNLGEQNPNFTGIVLNSKYHLNISVNITADTFSASLTSFQAGSTPVAIATNQSLGATVNPAQIAQVAATWYVANLNSPGSNALIFDNFSATVPEPSTYAMFGLGVGLAVLAVRRRARA